LVPSKAKGFIRDLLVVELLVPHDFQFVESLVLKVLLGHRRLRLDLETLGRGTDILVFGVQGLLRINELLIVHSSVDLECAVVEADCLTAAEVQLPMEVGHKFIWLHNIGRLMDLPFSADSRCSVLQVSFRLIKGFLMTWDEVMLTIFNELSQSLFIRRPFPAVDVFSGVRVTNVVL
jgi:hypothetical protein